mmetsp:Transcript_37387/g.90872  ORF Transcript_37387/g.90872 Transcript_37387/m.90872 type:complete len:283 (-) Transcript_37387:596-1444(-)
MINNLFGNTNASGASSSSADSSNKQDVEQGIVRDEDATFPLPQHGEDDHKKKNKTMEKTSTTATSTTTKVYNNEDRRRMTTTTRSTKDDDTTTKMTTAVVVAVDGEDVEAQTPQQQHLQLHISMLDRLCAPFERCCVGASGDITKLSSYAAAAVLSAAGGAGNIDENGGGGTTNSNNMMMDGNCIGAVMCPFESDTPAIKGDDDSSLADLAAKMRMMDSMDSETVEFDDGDDDKKSTSNNNKKKKDQLKWYRDPVHLTIFILCVLFSIAIVVLAILLIVSSK